MVQILGDVPRNLTRHIKSQNVGQYVLECEQLDKKSWDNLFHSIDDGLVDLLRGLLAYDPKERLSA